MICLVYDKVIGHVFQRFVIPKNAVKSSLIGLLLFLKKPLWTLFFRKFTLFWPTDRCFWMKRIKTCLFGTSNLISIYFDILSLIFLKFSFHNGCNGHILFSLCVFKRKHLRRALKLGISNCTIKNCLSSEFQVNPIKIAAVGASQS